MRPSPLWPRLLTHAVASVAVWAGAVRALAWYLPRWAEEEVRSGSLPSDGDTVAIPLFGFAVLFGAVLIVANVVAGRILARRRERSGPPRLRIAG